MLDRCSCYFKKEKIHALLIARDELVYLSAVVVLKTVVNGFSVDVKLPEVILQPAIERYSGLVLSGSGG